MIVVNEKKGIAGFNEATTSVYGALQTESVHIRKDGSSIPVEMDARKVVLDAESCIIAVVRDSTERKNTDCKQFDCRTNTYNVKGQYPTEFSEIV